VTSALPVDALGDGGVEAATVTGAVDTGAADAAGGIATTLATWTTPGVAADGISECVIVPR